MYLKKLVFLACLTFISASCGILYKNKIPQKIQIEIDSASVVNYGTAIPFKVIGHFPNGKTKNINNHPNLSNTVKGATLSTKRIIPTSFPTDFSDSVVQFKTSFIKDKVRLSDSIKLPFNYNSNLKLNFSGKSGNDGEKGSKGSLNFLTRDGTDGKTGEDGLEGESGNDLNVFVWLIGDTYFLRIDNITTQKSYFYRAGQGNHLVNLNVSGGSGGDGGNGGKGADGKDAEVKNGKTKESGKGGNGGGGGNGGNGGSPGNVNVYIHPSAIGFEKRIQVSQKSGQGGKMGKGNSGGTGGKEIGSNIRNIKGQDGYNGIEGQVGQNNSIVNMEVLDFNISNYKPN